MLKSAFTDRFKKHKVKLIKEDVHSVYQHFVIHRSVDKTTGSPIAHGTVKRYKAFGNLLFDFDPALRFEHFDEDLGNRFMSFCLERMSYVTYNRQLISLKSFCQYSFDKGYLKSSAFNDYKKANVNKNERDKLIITKNQIQTLLNLDLEDYLEKVRDLFVIGCYTGLRISDFKRINRSHLRNEGKTIVINHVKTQNVSKIPMSPVLSQLLDKYDYNLPYVGDATINRLIKKVCMLAGFNDQQTYMIDGVEYSDKFYNRITSHVAKRSFITMLDIAGVPISVISEITGTSVKTLLAEYIQVTQSDIDNVIGLL